MKSDIKHVHFIGIAGSAIAPIAVMMSELGWKVTGSDSSCWEPAKSLFDNNGIAVHVGKYDDLANVRDADLVIIGGGPLMIDVNNPEYLEAKTLNKDLHGFVYLVDKYIVHEQNIVVTGSYGKTTTTALTAWILDEAGKSPSFMLGGQPLDFERGVRHTDSEWSVIEGDEYYSVFHHDEVPKFYRYSPKYAILTSAQHDHVNIYPTEDSYVEAYYMLSEKVVENKGKLYVCASGVNNKKVLEQHMVNGGTYLTYKINSLPNRLAETVSDDAIDYIATNIQFGEQYTSFEVLHAGESLGTFQSPLIGMHNVENALSVIAVLHDLGISVKDIQAGLKSFKNVKRRMEPLGYLPTGAIVLDDFAHSPPKVKATLDAIRTRYTENNVVVLFNPRLSNNEGKDSIKPYEGVFDQADHVIIPKIIVKASQAENKRVYGKDFLEVIGKTNKNVSYIPKTEKIKRFLAENTDKNSVFVIMSAKSLDSFVEGLDLRPAN